MGEEDGSTGVRLVERDSQLAELVRYAQEAAHGAGRLILLSGEAGVGKSALLTAARRELTAARWSWSTCDGLFIPQPLGPLFDVAEQLGGALAERCAAGGEREELFRALVQELGSGPVPDVVVVEDVHWADEATLDLLRFLGRRLRDVAAAVIVTYRDDEAGGNALRVALGDLAAQPSTRRIRLAPLSADAVRILAEGSGFAPDDVFRLTAGNPFYVTELLQAQTRGVPASTRDVVLARAARLDAQARSALETAALLGAKVELPLLATLSDATGLDGLLASGLLVADGMWLRFRHEIARLAIAEAVPAHRCLLTHRRALEALYAQGCDDEARLAYHAEAAGDADAVLCHAPAAARRASRLGAHYEAAAQFARALRFADRTGPAERANLYEKLADEQVLIDRCAEAEAAAQQALMLRRELGDRFGEGEALARLSRITWNLCRTQEATTWMRAALVVLEPLGPTVELAGAYATLAQQRLLYADNENAIDLARRARELAARFDSTAAMSVALNTEAAARAGLGLEWADVMRQALDIALAGRHHDQTARAYATLGSINENGLQFADAERFLAEGIAYCDEHDITRYNTSLRSGLAHVYERTGRWDEAVALAEQVLGEAGPLPLNRHCALVRLGVILARRGAEGFWPYLDEAAATADAQGEPQYLVRSRLARTEAHWLAGRSAQARQAAESAIGPGTACSATERGAVAVWLRRTGSRRSVPGAVAEPYRHMLDGKAEKAAAVWTELGCPYDAGLALIDSGDEQLLQQAYRIFTDLGATATEQLLRRTLRRLGVRAFPTGPRATTRAHPLGLTRRQHDVLGLIADGHTNAQIAERLFISAKTVDHHVSAILAKLQAPDRAAAGRIARSGMRATAM
ncbi:AAA family ATPase [Catenulispora yoronensis]|uniref:AAA family ATPase n=1 Tax=Catenulispora yoronensis TaxID=450799 RepID=A0ABN2V0Y3_9ACTN